MNFGWRRERLHHVEAIKEMRELCRVTARAPGFGCSQPGAISTEGSSSKPCGSSGTATSSEALVSARAKLRKLKELSLTTSPPSTEPHEPATGDPAACKVADVVAIYAEDVVHKHARPQETAARLDRILNFFGETTD